VGNLSSEQGSTSNLTKKEISGIHDFGKVWDMLGDGRKLLEQAASAADLAIRWKALVGSLQKTKDATEDCSEAVVELGDTLTGIKTKITEYDLHSLFDGKITEDDVEHLTNVGGVCLDVMRDLLSCAEELDTFSNLAKMIVDVANEARQLTRKHNRACWCLRRFGPRKCCAALAR